MYMLRTLNKLFSLQLDAQEDLFGLIGNSSADSYQYEKTDIDFLMAYFHGRIDVSQLDGKARVLFELSSGIFDTVIHAWLSELPIEKELAAFCKKLIAVYQPFDDHSFDKKRSAAQKVSRAALAALDRTDTDTLTVLNTSEKVFHEVHRLMGLLRFSPDKKGEFIARCEPDHFVLPALAVYFTARFGETSWSIIDEKRGLCLNCRGGGEAKINLETETVNAANGNDEWEDLWKHYHKTINNEDRNNPDLQRQLMPQRYWKYLPEKME